MEHFFLVLSSGCLVRNAHYRRVRLFPTSERFWGAHLQEKIPYIYTRWNSYINLWETKSPNSKDIEKTNKASSFVSPSWREAELTQICDYHVFNLTVRGWLTFSSHNCLLMCRYRPHVNKEAGSSEVKWLAQGQRAIKQKNHGSDSYSWFQSLHSFHHKVETWLSKAR